MSFSIKDKLATSRPPVAFGKSVEVKPITGIHFTTEEKWQAYYKGVLFGEFLDLKDAHDRLQKLIALDSTK